MRLCVYKVGEDRLLGYSAFSDTTVGAYVPGDHGNYYHHLIVGGTIEDMQYTPGADSWLGWLTNAIHNGWVKIDEDFPFDPNEVKIVVVEIP
jgi:hypothetical protein